MNDPLAFRTDREERSFRVYYARVMLREARARRDTPGFHAWLLGCAARSRRRAAELTPRDLFGAAA